MYGLLRSAGKRAARRCAHCGQVLQGKLAWTVAPAGAPQYAHLPPCTREHAIRPACWHAKRPRPAEPPGPPSAGQFLSSTTHRTWMPPPCPPSSHPQASITTASLPLHVHLLPAGLQWTPAARAQAPPVPGPVPACRGVQGGRGQHPFHRALRHSAAGGRGLPSMLSAPRAPTSK